jgi:hypothetical protein
LQSINFAKRILRSRWTRGYESALTRVFDALCPRVTQVDGQAPRQ